MKTVVLLMVLFLTSCAERQIIEMPITFDAERAQLTLDYMSTRYGIVKETPTIDPKMVVVHWTVIPTLEKTFAAFDQSQLPGARAGIAGASVLNVSSQFLIDIDGTIYRLLPETTMARHVIGLNHCAIGIENVGPGEDGELTSAQLDANIWLIKYLKDKYPIEHVIGHYEYTDFENHELWLEVDDGYRTEKDDPGEKFMTELRAALE
jgi:hypothetical protein